MTRKVSKAQESLWSENTVALGRDPETKPKSVIPASGRRSAPANRRRIRVLAGCALALAFTVITVAVLVTGNENRRPARQPSPPEIRSADQRTEPQRSMARAPHSRMRNHGRRRPRVAVAPGDDRGRKAIPGRKAEPAADEQPAEPSETPSEVSALPPASPPEPPASSSPTSPSTEFGIERN
jgi:hypothetical protein